MKSVILAAAVVCAGAASVSAQDFVPSGWYGGFTAGLLGGGYEDQFGFALDYSGFSVGAFGGYRENFGGALLGGELSAEALALNSSSGAAFGVPSASAGLTSRFAARATLGLPSGQYVPYIAVGPVLAHQRYQADPTRATGHWHLGGEVAAGVDMALTETSFVRGELRYSVFSTETYNIGLGNYSAKPRGAVDLKLGIGLQF